MLSFTTLAKASVAQLMRRTLPHELRRLRYTNLVRGLGDWYLYAPGEIPVMLVAHVDTAHRGSPSKVFYDPKARIYWSPDGLGADDRAGVYAILQVLAAGFQPHVLFTNYEESGGLGAEAAALDLRPRVNVLVELDRRGADDACFYGCCNEDLKKYIAKFGFKEAIGTFTDVSILGPEWNIGAVNLSVGYYNAHTKAEYLVMSELETTVERVARMLANPPATQFEWGVEMPNCVLCGEEGAVYQFPGMAAETPICSACYMEVIGEWPAKKKYPAFRSRK